VFAEDYIMLFIETMHRVVDLLIMSSAEVSRDVNLITGSVTRYGNQPVVLCVSKYQVTVAFEFVPASGQGWVERFGLVRGTAVNELLNIVKTTPKRLFSCKVDVDFNRVNQATALRVISGDFVLTMPRLRSIQLTDAEIQLWRPRVWILQSINSASSLYKLSFFTTTMELWFKDVSVDERLFLLLQYFFSNTVGVEHAQNIIVEYCNSRNYEIGAAVGLSI
jgi:hypothetical protein